VHNNNNNNQLTILTAAITDHRSANWHLKPSKQPGYLWLPVGKFCACLPEPRIYHPYCTL